MISKNWDIHEDIRRGNPCSACGADWANHELIHRPKCSYWAWMQKERTTK